MLFYFWGFLILFFSLMMFLFSLIFLFNKMSYIFEWFIFSVNSVDMYMYMYVDWMSLMFMFTVMFITSMILFYCVEYMNHDYNKIRFFYTLMMFVFSMLILILSPNMASMLVGWDGLGLTSYCLVIFYQNMKSYNSGMLTILMNRVGDVMIILSISLMYLFGSWNFMSHEFLFLLILFMIMISGFTKSAQFPFSSWLPAAMAAPTPVSSLVHSSTLVTAGIYLLIRFNYLIYLSSEIMFFILMTGMLTMFMSGFCAIFEFDMKKIIAYSTLSQLGLMFSIFSMKKFDLAFLHLITHAMFKSMMFMCSGVFIHSMINYQDIRYMGKLKDYFPMTSIMFLISNFSLCGLPFMSGFYSKDIILEFMMMSNLSFLLYILLLVSTGLTLIYSFRLFFYLMSNKNNFMVMYNSSDFKMMNFPMIFLMFLSIFLGLLLNWLILFNIELVYLFISEKIMIMFICILFFLYGIYMYKYCGNFIMSPLKSFFGKMWFSGSFNMILYKNPLISSFFVEEDLEYKFVLNIEYFFLNSIYSLNFDSLLSKNYLVMFIFMASFLYFSIFLFI